MAKHPQTRFEGKARLSPEEHERTLFGRVCDAIGVTAAFVAHDVMPDIRAKLIDEGWFGRPAYPGQSHSPESGAPWRTPTTLTIDGEFSRADAPRHTPDHDLDR
jgi:hypothetical protein